MKFFISHNSKQKRLARALANALLDQGAVVWLDEWRIRPGDSLIGGIEAGLQEADTFLLLWSEQAAASNWVGTEVRAYLSRRVKNQSLRIVPIMLDETPLPSLLSDYRGFFGRRVDPSRIAREVCGSPSDAEIIERLRGRLLQLAMDPSSQAGDPLPYRHCPMCGANEFLRTSATDDDRDETYYMIECIRCHWSEWTQ